MNMNLQYRELIAEKYYKYLCTAKDEGGYKVYVPPLRAKGGRIIPDYATALVKARDTIEELEIDPVVYFRAQLRVFEQRSKRKNSMLPPKFLWDKGAVRRVQKWIADTKERYNTTNINSVPDTIKDVERLKMRSNKATYQKILNEYDGNKLLSLCLSASVCDAQFLVDELITIDEEDWDDFIEYVKTQDPIKYEQIKDLLSS